MGAATAGVPCPSARTLMEKIVDFARGFGAYPRHFGEIRRCCALDRLESSEVMQERSLAGWANAWNFLQAGFAQPAPSPQSVRTDGESMRFVTQPLHEIQHGIARGGLRS